MHTDIGGQSFGHFIASAQQATPQYTQKNHHVPQRFLPQSQSSLGLKLRKQLEALLPAESGFFGVQQTMFTAGKGNKAT